jgi:hypothetical protein
MIAAVRSGDLYHPTYTPPNLGTCKMGSNFVVDVTERFDATVPAAGADQLVWTTPNEPFLIEHALLMLTGPATASEVPPTTNLELTVAGYGLIAANMSPWTSTTYALSGNNLVMWMQRAGLGILDNIDGTGTARRGAMSIDWVFAALSAGVDPDGFWGKPVNFHVSHGAGNVHMTIPFRAFIAGRFL